MLSVGLIALLGVLLFTEDLLKAGSTFTPPTGVFTPPTGVFTGSGTGLLEKGRA